MTEIVNNLRALVQGWKTYLICASAVIAALLGWVDGNFTGPEAFEMIWHALAGMSLRAAVHAKK